MLKQSNFKFDLDVNTTQSVHRRGELLVSKQSNMIIEPIVECPLIERVEQDLIKDRTRLRSIETKEDLFKLKKITNDVQRLTKQLENLYQQPSSLNRNNNANHNHRLDERLLGELSYQLERRILLLIFSNHKQFYGYSLRYLPSLIRHEHDQHERQAIEMRYRQIRHYLNASLFRFDYHPFLTFYLINECGIYKDYSWLEQYANILADLNRIKSVCFSMLPKEFHDDLTIIIDSLQAIAHMDGKALFYW